ncbi:NADAR family protein [candidate division WWE3 bacterium]|uniref:NADAR family protein n=1 Tax=candidate division WWE3 bacterium TaxID=2053526 RepID=A0A955LGW6_UNCKA|nr:NADAR family protein [candidate division WWE3 bacterium]
MKDVIAFYDESKEYFEFANYYPAPILLDGTIWSTVEHYFQAQKTNIPEWKEKIRSAENPDEAKKIGWEVPDYNDEYWLAHRDEVMSKAVIAKIGQHPHIRELLISTGSQTLIEDSPNDTYWGMVQGHGENRMGKLLMKIRETIRSEDT